MTINFIRLILLCTLPLTASSQNATNVTTEITGNFTHDQVTQEMMSNFTSSITADVNPKGEETMKTNSSPLLSATQTPASTALLTDTSTDSISSQTNSMKSMTEGKFEVTTLATMVVSNQVSNPTTPTGVPPMLSSSTQSQEAGKLSTSIFTSDKTTHSSTSLTPSTNPVSTTTSSTKNISIHTPPAIGGDTTQSTALSKTSKTTAKTPLVTTTRANKKPDPPLKKINKGTSHGKIVAGLIGGALVLMMVGFLIIYLKKRKLQEQQITTSDWAGPSPFLEGGADNGGVALRSSNRISLSSFLPQRLSKRLSLLQETDEELQEITAGTTFGSKYQGSSFGREVDENSVKERNGNAASGPEMKSTEDAAETVENSASATSSKTDDAPSTNDNSETANQSSPPAPSEAVENATAQTDEKEK